MMAPAWGIVGCRFSPEDIGLGANSLYSSTFSDVERSVSKVVHQHTAAKLQHC